MTNAEVHAELSLLGVSSEVHQLVDDLGLALGHVPSWLMIRSLCSRKIWPAFDYVHKSYRTQTYRQGELFD